MRLELTGRHVRITPALRSLVDERLEKLDRRLHTAIVSMQVVLSLEKQRHRVEMTLHARGEHFFHGAGSGRDWDSALNQALGKVDQQALKLKGKWDDGRRRGASAARTAPAAPRSDRSDEPGQIRVIRARRYDVKPMSVEEAALEVTGGDSVFLVFRNASTDTINVLFRRPDGNLGLIEPEA